MFDLVKTYALIGLAALCVVLSLSTCEYRRQYKSTALALSVQNEAIKARNDEANRKLVRLTEERDSNQLLLNESVKATTKIQGDFDVFLKKVRAAAAAGPAPAIRVRVAACDAGSSGGSTTLAVPGRPAVGFGTGAAPAQLLSPGAARRTEIQLIEVEELSRDFNLCQTSLKGRLATEKK